MTQAPKMIGFQYNHHGKKCHATPDQNWISAHLLLVSVLFFVFFTLRIPTPELLQLHPQLGGVPYRADLPMSWKQTAVAILKKTIVNQ